MDFNKQYDIAVVGGGIAGVAAALQAARSGHKTVLLEKTVLLGGLATTGMIYIYLPLCDGNGNQVTFGICEELIKVSAKYGPGDIPDGWSQSKNGCEAERYRAIFSPASFILAIEELLLEAGVDIWLDTLVCQADVDDQQKLNAVYVENKSGRGRIDASCFIDASGDCDIARKAGAPCLSSENNMAIWALEYQAGAKFDPDYFLAENVNMFLGGYGAACQNIPSEQHYETLSGATVSDFVLKGHQYLRDRYQTEYSSGKANRQSLFPLKLPAMAQFRKTYCIDGHVVLQPDQHATFCEDSIGLVADWRKPGYVWEIPFRTLIPKNVKGLLAAGRCSAATGDAWEITRVIPAAALTGQVAGLAAGNAITAGIDVSQVDINQLQSQLTELGFPLHEETTERIEGSNEK